jgi:hypothetical protein
MPPGSVLPRLQAQDSLQVQCPVPLELQALVPQAQACVSGSVLQAPGSRLRF